MMMSGDKKKIAQIIVSRIKPQGGLEDLRQKNSDSFNERAKNGEQEPEMDEGILSAAEEAMKAVQMNDAKGFATAMMDFLELADKDDGDDKDDEEGDDEGQEQTNPNITG